MRFLPFQLQSAITSLNKTNLLVLVMKEQCVFCKVRTEVLYTVIPRSYTVGGYDTEGVSRDRFSQKNNVKLRRVVVDSLF